MSVSREHCARIESLEKRVRMLTGALVVAVGAGAFTLIGGLAQPEQKDTVAASRFVLVDEDGNIAAMLSSNAGGSFLMLNGADRSRRVLLGATEDGAALELTGGAANAQISMGVGEGGPLIALKNDSGQEFVMIEE